MAVNESCRMKARSSICTCPPFGTRSVFCSDGLEVGLVKRALVVAVDRRSTPLGTGHWAALSGVLLSFQRSLVPDGALYIMMAIMRFRPPGWPLRLFSGEWTLESRKRKPENAFFLRLRPQGLEPQKTSKATPNLCLRLKGSSGLSKAPVGLRTTRVSFSN